VVPRPITTDSQHEHEPSRALFTVQRANEALVLIRRIVPDIVKNYAELLNLRDEREELMRSRGQAERLEELAAAIEERAALLSRLHEELCHIGCVLKDWKTGLVDFPAVREGQHVWLCWRLGEPAVAYWHSLEGGFAGRQPVGDDGALFSAAGPETRK